MTLGPGSNFVTQELGDSGMKRLRQNEEQVSAPPCCRGDLCTTEDDEEPQCQGLVEEIEPEKEGLVRVDGPGVCLCGDRTARLCTAPVQPAQLQASLLGRCFILFHFMV